MGKSKDNIGCRCCSMRVQFPTIPLPLLICLAKRAESLVFSIFFSPSAPLLLPSLLPFFQNYLPISPGHAVCHFHLCSFPFVKTHKVTLFHHFILMCATSTYNIV